MDEQFNLPLAGWPQALWIQAQEELWEPIINQVLPMVHLADGWVPLELLEMLKIEQIKELRLFAGSSPVGALKIAVLPQADRWPPVIANALLKLLEEPPVYLRLILLSESDNLLPTIKSRVTHLPIFTSQTGIQPLNPESEERHSDRTKWQALLAKLDPKSAQQRAQIRAILYRVPLMHAQVQQGPIQKAWKAHS